METIVRAALAAGGTGRMASEGPDTERDHPPEPPASPSPTVWFASPVAIPLASKDELARPPLAASGAGDDVEAPTGRSEVPDYMAVTVSSLLSQQLRAGASQNADLTAMTLIGFSAFIYSLCVNIINAIIAHFIWYQ